MEKDSLTWIGQLVFLEKLNAQFDLRENWGGSYVENSDATEGSLVL